MAGHRLFENREDAGRQLASALASYRDSSPLVLGLPRGGVPVAFEVASALDAPLDVWVVRKVGAPVEPELGIGAVAEGGEVYLDRATIAMVGASDEEVEQLVAAKSDEVEQRSRLFRRGRSAPDVRGRTVLVVDDGVATGGTARAALRAIRRRGPSRLVFAAPVGSTDTLESLRDEADDIVCLGPEERLVAIGLWYEDFAPTTDDEVIALLEKARGARANATVATEAPAAGVRERGVGIGILDAELEGDLAVPRGAQALVLFAHGSGSSRKSPRNRFVAEALRRAGLGTLLFDLLTADEEEIDELDAHLRFDIDLLARRLVAVTDWTRSRAETRTLRIGYFGASTGAAAALVAAAERPSVVEAVVSRGGRPDLAGTYLPRVKAPTLLIVGGYDDEVLELNRLAMDALHAPKELAIVPRATHLFAEPGALEHVAALASEWFVRHLATARQEARP